MMVIVIFIIIIIIFIIVALVIIIIIIIIIMKTNVTHLFGSSKFENLGKTTVLTCEMFTSTFRSGLKYVSCLSFQLIMMKAA